MRENPLQDNNSRERIFDIEINTVHNFLLLGFRNIRSRGVSPLPSITFKIAARRILTIRSFQSVWQLIASAISRRSVIKLGVVIWNNEGCVQVGVWDIDDGLNDRSVIVAPSTPWLRKIRRKKAHVRQRQLRIESDFQSLHIVYP